ncbi:expressed unknown protein [Seminavis robusta]|uniref:LRRK2 ARM repeat domain-containing protein n=1 Tax=Seminavis robusta TaxID=568900 RepID=A0A9N8H8P7_9STRA|nr:expressed unknown protein [Seminavis robusta]|eukprot:Sro248_g098210.1 n/a (1111) ;mRNA; f:2380-5712
MLPLHPIDLFSEDGTVVTEADREALAARKGKCSSCDIPTHKVAFPLRKVPLTNDHVYQGQCIRCSHLTNNNNNSPQQTHIPEHVRTTWEQKYPHLVIASSSRQRGHNRKPSHGTSIRQASLTSSQNSQRRSEKSSLSPMTRSRHHVQLPTNLLDDSEHASGPTSSRSMPLRNSATNPACVVVVDQGHRRCHSQGNPHIATSPHKKCAATTPMHHHRKPSRGNPIPPLPLNTSHHQTLRQPTSHPQDWDVACNEDAFLDALLLSAITVEAEEDGVHPLLRDSSTPGCHETHHHDVSHAMSSGNNNNNRVHVLEDTPVVNGMPVVLANNNNGMVVTNGVPITGEQSKCCNCGHGHSSSASILLTRENIHHWLHQAQLPEDFRLQIVDNKNNNNLIEAITMEMKVSKCNKTVQRNGCRILYQYCTSTASDNWVNGDEETTKGICSMASALISAINCNVEDPVVVEHASLTLDQLMPAFMACSQQHNSNYDRVQRAIRLATEALVAALERQQGNLPAQQAITKTLYWYNFMTEKESTTVVQNVMIAKQAKLLPTLQACMQEHVHDELLQQYACGILNLLLVQQQQQQQQEKASQDAAESSSNHEYNPVVALLCLIMDRHRKIVCVQQEAMACLYSATVNNSLVEAVEISAVVEAMKAHPKDKSVQSFGCGVIRNVSVRKTNVSVIEQCGGIDVIARAMDAHPGEMMLQCSGCRALKHLAVDDSMELLIQQKGGIGTIIQSLQGFPLEAELQREGYAALAHLSHRKDSKSILVRHPGLATMLVAAMKQHRQDGNVQQKVCSVLLNLSLSETFTNAFDQLGGITLVAAAMTNHAEDVKLQQYAIGSLQNFCRKGNCSATLRASGAIEAAIHSMSAYGGNLKIQMHALGFIKNASTHKETAIQIAQAGGVRSIREVTEKHTYNAALHLEACLAMVNMSRAKEVGATIVENGGVSIAICAMRQHVDSAAAQYAGCGLLWSLSATTSTSHDVIASQGGVRSILQAMKKHPKAADVQQKACLALYNLTPHEGCRKGIEENGRGVILAVTAMREHGSDLPIQRYACKFLALMVRGGKHNVDILTANGGVPVVNAALESFRSNDDVQKYGTRIVEIFRRSHG